MDFAVAVVDLHVLSLNAAELLSISARQVIHRFFRKVEAGGCMVDCKDIDCFVLVCDGIASAALQRVRFTIIDTLEGSKTVN